MRMKHFRTPPAAKRAGNNESLWAGGLSAPAQQELSNQDFRDGGNRRDTRISKIG